MERSVSAEIAPFGGTKDSGIVRLLGAASLRRPGLAAK
jgi:hypothetical protein